MSGDLPSRIRLETIDAPALWSEFLDENLDALLEIGDRGTYLDRDELRSFFELSIPGVDEIMGWTRIGQLVDSEPDRLTIVDTAPTGHTLRLLSSGRHWRSIELVLESMQAKHREIVAQLTRRTHRDHLDDFLEGFESGIARTEELFRDHDLAAFIPVALAEPWVVEQTRRLTEDLMGNGIAVPFAILNRTVSGCDCPRCAGREIAEAEARESIPVELIAAPRACGPMTTTEELSTYLDGEPTGTTAGNRSELTLPGGSPHEDSRLVFLVGKGGVGKTTMASALALRAAARGERVILLSVDPAHAVRDVFSRIDLPENLTVETIDTRAAWAKLEEQVGRSVSAAISAISPRGFSNVHDETITRQLLEIAPPGADEIFALVRILELWEDDELSRIVVDTAPTGHFLRLLELPELAGEWIRQLMRITLRYREVLASSSLGQKLLDASRSLREFQDLVRDEACEALPVTRPEQIVLTETERLIRTLRSRGLRVGQVILNDVAVRDDCACDSGVALAAIRQAAWLEGIEPVIVTRRDTPPVNAEDLMEIFTTDRSPRSELPVD